RVVDVEAPEQTAWRANAPWSTDAQVEQDLVICRAVVDLSRPNSWLARSPSGGEPPCTSFTSTALLEHPRLQSQLIGLERRTSRGGRDSIDHAPGAKDDVANAAAGVLVRAAAHADCGAVLFSPGRSVVCEEFGDPIPVAEWGRLGV